VATTALRRLTLAHSWYGTGRYCKLIEQTESGHGTHASHPSRGCLPSEWGSLTADSCLSSATRGKLVHRLPTRTYSSHFTRLAHVLLSLFDRGIVEHSLCASAASLRTPQTMISRLSSGPPTAPTFIQLYSQISFRLLGSLMES
jgi:hypothetical protein